MLRIFLISFCFFLSGVTMCFSSIQNPPNTAPEIQLKNLSGAERVRYINQNYYKLYSADFKNAEALLEWSVSESRKLGLKREHGFALLYSGVVKYLSGNYPAVLEKYLAALKLFEDLKDSEGIAATHNEMAVFYHKQNDLENCFKSLDIAERTSRETGDLERLGTTLGNRGAILSVRGRIKEAGPYFNEVYKIRVRQNDSTGLGYVLLDLAEVALAEGDQAACMAYIDQSTTIREKINDRYGVVVNMVFRGEMYMRAGNIPRAVWLLEEGNRQAQTIGYPDLVRQSADLLTKAWRTAGDPEKAFRFHEQSDILKDSLFSLEKARVVEELQTKYESEKKDFEIREQRYLLNQDRWLIGFLSLCVLLLGAFFALWRQRLLTKRDKILTEQRIIHQKEMTTALISSQEQERTRFASDLHDGMGQVMSSLRIVLQRSSGQTPPTAIELLDQMHRDIRGIAFDLSPTTLKEEGLPAALRELVARLNQSSVIQITVGETGMETRLPSEMELAFYRITQEWLNNIFRHGGAHKINLQIIRHPDQISLIIEDDGPGFDSDKLEKSSGNGWRNIQSRLVPFSGSVHLDSQKGKQGTVFLAEFPFVS